MSDNASQSQFNWIESISANITFFRDQSKLLKDAYNPSQIASGALMAVLIMNHNILMARLDLMEKHLETLERLINDAKPSSPRL